ncbi:MAG: pyruvate kinase [Candidatus Auribacterota bacterium]|nr:pyruvate kinase [Candidatus Auribacterota bacterium]
MKKTKIVCTIGPASDSPEMIEKLIKAGMDVARLNFSHGTHEGHAEKIRIIRETADRLGRTVAILTDIAGPKIRVGEISRGSVELKKGRNFILTDLQVPGDEQEVSVTYQGLPELVRKGDTILLADGGLELKVTGRSKNRIRCRVIEGGVLSSHKGVNLPTRSAGIPILTEKDHDDLRFIIKQDVDYVGISFVRSAEEVDEVRALLKKKRSKIHLIAKIEKPEAVENIDAIIEAADGIMVARGDLGVELPFEEVPVLQKMIISKSNRAGKPVITATQMMESMVKSSRPTRAEVSDVATAIFDGTDAVMLSEETAAGANPVQAVRAMVRVAREVESGEFYRDANREWLFRLYREQEELPVEESVARSACFLADGIRARSIMVHTASGSAARRVAKYRPDRVIVAPTFSRRVARLLILVRGVMPLIITETEDFYEMIREAAELSIKEKYLKKGDLVVVTAGVPLDYPGHTNVIGVIRAGEERKTF